ncbi:protein of unknown function [Saccharopolyspora antimicrobica]|uniref:Uncharacterized protein DUF397 n=1 Tax=Saccharopolyspora antimicrobica TaxID=455193 RepID=A0A1I5G5Q6_9PSEU|nr:DUF397 domain-containing protein [Saccharopolyspora antimicrobica]RKT83916.1 uncharacterized protein DUF397 [Saccharopolyspora antimicrobica]SFO31246.1 protein of unknown function [Saccharopolyspora antimicrobica]
MSLNSDETTWRKSSRSGSTSNCVEVAWRKSSWSNGAQNCVEVALEAEVIGVRDSKDAGGAVLAFSSHQWTAFVSGLRERRW